MPPRELTDDYRLEKILGSSRSGSILRASRIDSGRNVVIKLINVPAPAEPALASGLEARFSAYAAALARIRHPNLPAVVDSGVTPDGGAFLVMERLDGVGFEAGAPELAAAGGNGAAPEHVLPLLAQALAGLEELARHGLAHLNLCPENLFLVPAAPAAGADPGAAAPQTVKLLGLGTPLFHLGEPWPEAPCARFRAPELASPAAARQQQLPGWQADCYSLALTACYALGATVASGESDGTLVQTVQMPLALRFELANDEALRQILERCLRRSPPERPVHGAIREAFRLALGGVEPAPGAAGPGIHGEIGGALPPGHGALDDVGESAAAYFADPVDAAGSGEGTGTGGTGEPAGSGGSGGVGGPGGSGGSGDSGDQGRPGDWRSLLSDSEPPPEGPRWHRPADFGRDSAPAAATNQQGTAAGQGRIAAAGAAPAIAAATGGDSLLDLFDVPATLPALPEDEDPLGTAGAAFGLHLPDGFELPPAAGGFDADPLGAGVATEFAGPEPEPEPEPRHPPVTVGSAGSMPSPRGAGLAEGPTAAGAGAVEALRAAAQPLQGAGQPPQADAQPLQGAAPPPRAAGALTAQAPAAASIAPAGQAAAPFSRTEAQPLSRMEAQPPSRMEAQPPSRTEAQPPGGLEPAAAPEGEVLSAVDELLGSLPPPPPVAAPPPGARTTPRLARGGRGAGTGAAPAAGSVGSVGTASSTGGAAPAAARGSSAMPDSERTLLAPLLALPRPVLLAGGGVLLLAAGVAAWVLVGHASRQAPPVRAGVDGPAAPAGPPPTPGRSAAAKFFDAKSYLIFGKESDGRVRQALRELTYADQAEIGPAGCKQLAAIQQVLAAEALETVQLDLAGALRNGDLGALEDVVEVASERDLPPSQHGDFARATSLVRLYQGAGAAAAAGDHAQVLERFRAMQGLSKTLHDPLELRDKAAQAIEADALALARDGKYDESLARLGPILTSWPERAGIKDLVKSYQTAAASEAQQVAILDSVPMYESRRKPSVPLDLLRPLQPTPHLEQRMTETKQRLEAQLAQLDAQPPQVVLRPGYPLDYSRGTMITLSFRVTDDYEVKSVKLFARPEAGKLRELTLQKSAFGWDVEIPPSFHQNGTVELYVVATDLSGHEGYLGTKENPLRVTRRQGFQQLLH